MEEDKIIEIALKVVKIPAIKPMSSLMSIF